MAGVVERIDPATWEIPRVRTALASRNITALYRELQRNGVSQRRIAVLTGQGQPEVYAILRGRRVGSYDVLARIADGLGVPRGYMGLAYDGTSLGAANTSHEEADQMPDRREFFGLMGKLAAGAGLSAGELQALAVPWSTSPIPARVGQPEVEQLVEATAFLRAQDLRYGAGAVRDAVFGQLQRGRALLASSYTPQIGLELHTAMAHLLNLAGWISKGLLRRGEALRYLGQALHTAQLAEAPELQARILADMARIYLMDVAERQPRDALTLLQLARIPAQRAESPVLGAYLAAHEARAHAAMADEARALDALDRAAFLVAAGTRAPSGVMEFHQMKLCQMQGYVHGDLGVFMPKHNAVAAQLLRTYLDEVDRQFGKRRGMTLATLASVHFRAGAVDEGCAAVHQALDLLPSLRSPSVLKRVEATRRDMRKHAHVRTVKELEQRFAEIAASSSGG